jgi:NAD-dependent deacetylase
VVWFGESLPVDAITGAVKESRNSDLFFVIGTSAVVEPAASLPRIAKEAGVYLVEVNIERTPVSGFADDIYLGKAGEILPALLANL